MTTPVKREQKQNNRFRPGKSGNPKGRTPGSRSKATALLDALGTEAATEVLGAVIEAAKGGDMAAARLLLDRCWPAAKGRPVPLALGAVDSPAGVQAALAAICAAMADGRVSPDEASVMAGVVSATGRAMAGEIEVGITIGGGISGLMKAANQYLEAKALTCTD